MAKGMMDALSMDEFSMSPCFPYDASQIPVLGDGDWWRGDRLGAEKVLVPFRRQTFFVQFTQAGAGADLVSPAQSVNLFSYGSTIGTFQGNASTFAGLTSTTATNYGVITYVDSNFYPNGLLCQPEYEYVISGMAARCKPLFEVAGGGVSIRGDYLDVYQAEAQQMVLENTVWTYQMNRVTCQILGEDLTKYISPFSSGFDGQAVSQNGEKLKDNIMALCAGLVVRAESGTAVGAAPDASLTMATKAITLRLNALAPPPAAPAVIVCPVEILFYGYCRCRTDDGICAPTPRRAPAATPVLAQIPTPP